MKLGLSLEELEKEIATKFASTPDLPTRLIAALPEGITTEHAVSAVTSKLLLGLVIALIDANNQRLTEQLQTPGHPITH